MTTPQDSDSSQPVVPPGGFATTKWTMVMAAGDRASPTAGQALEDLCQAYWPPLYAYVRRRVSDVHEAQDLTQAFFTQLLARGYLAAATPTRGRFRAFLLTACKNFLAKEWEKAQAQKRGGGQTPISLDFNAFDSSFPLEPSTSITAEQLFDRQWAITLLNRVLDGLCSEMAAEGKEDQFHVLKQTIVGDDSLPYRELAEQLATTEAAVKMAVHRLRRRYRERLREEILQTVPGAEDVDEEIRSLFATFGQL